MAPGPAPATVHDRRWWILGTLVLSLLVVVLDVTVLNVALTTIQQDLGATQSELAWAVSSYLLVVAALLFTHGVLADRYGRRSALVVGLTLFACASALSAFAQTPEQLIAYRALMGIGAAAVLPSTLSIITNVFGPAERPTALGIWAGSVGAALAIGPISGGLLLERFWWGSVFLVNVPVVAVVLVGVLATVPESREPSQQRLDPLGVLLSLAGLLLVVYGIIRGGETTEWTSPAVLGPLVAGALALALFVVLQRRSRSPMLDVSLFGDPAFSAACAAASLVMFALFGAVFFLSFYLQYAREYSPLETGIRLLPVAIALALFAPRSAGPVRRFGSRAVCATGLVVVAVSFLGYRFVDETTSTWAVPGLLFLQGAGTAHVLAPATESIMSTVPRERAGAGAAVNTSLRAVGGALGVAVLGSVLAASYRSRLEPRLESEQLVAVPPALRETAAESLGGTLLAAEQLPISLAAPLERFGVDALVAAMHNAAVVAGLMALLAAAVVLRWLPGRGTTTSPELARAAP